MLRLQIVFSRVKNKFLNFLERNISMSKILITGGAGFIGAHLANNLKKNNKIMIVDNLENKGGIPYIDKSNFLLKEIF